MTGPRVRRAPARSRRYELTAGDGAVRECRELTERALSDCFGHAGEPGQAAAEDALLLVSEVVLLERLAVGWNRVPRAGGRSCGSRWRRW
ncbi:hypothetical protein [Streptomyces sp. NPDC003863]